MEAVELRFCIQCCEKILSRELTLFWKLSCLNSVTNFKWIPFDNSDENHIYYIKILESKKFIISIDHEDKIFAKLEGIIPIYDSDNFLICLKPSKHFTNYSKKE